MLHDIYSKISNQGRPCITHIKFLMFTLHQQTHTLNKFRVVTVVCSGPCRVDLRTPRTDEVCGPWLPETAKPDVEVYQETGQRWVEAVVVQITAVSPILLPGGVSPSPFCFETRFLPEKKQLSQFVL